MCIRDRLFVVDSAPSRPNRTCRKKPSATATTTRSSSSTVQYLAPDGNLTGNARILRSSRSHGGPVNNYQPRAPHPGRTAVKPQQQDVQATSCNTQLTPGEGMWAQYDFGDGPRVAGTATVLFCFWLAWCRFRVVLPLLDKTLPSVHAAVDVALRRVGGVPTYLLSENVPRNIFGILWPAGLCGRCPVDRRPTSVVVRSFPALRHITLVPGEGDFLNPCVEKGSCHVGGVLRQAGDGRSDPRLVDRRGDRELPGLAGRPRLQHQEHLAPGPDRVRVRGVRSCARSERRRRVACARGGVRGRPRRTPRRTHGVDAADGKGGRGPCRAAAVGCARWLRTSGRPKHAQPFADVVPGFFGYLVEE